MTPPWKTGMRAAPSPHLSRFRAKAGARAHGAGAKVSHFLCLASAAAVLAVTGCGGDDAPRKRADSAAGSSTLTTVKLPRGTWPRSLRFDHRGTLWIAETSADAIAERTPDGRISHHRLGEATETSVGDLVFAADGNLWFQGFQLVGWLTPDGQVFAYQLGFNGRGRPEVGLPSAMTKGPDGNAWYASDAEPPAIKRVTTDGTIRTYRLPSTAKASGFGGIATGPDGALWFTQTGESEAIGRLHPKTGYERFRLPHDNAGLGRITAGPDGALWFTEQALYRIGRISTDGAVAEFPLKVGTVPAELIAGRDGALWFTTRREIGRMTTTGAVELWPIPGATNLWGIAQARDGALWVTDPEAALLYRFVPPTT
jgi:virginiamycin B lyase